MKIELINKEFKLKETQYILEHHSQKLSTHNHLGVKGQKVTLIDIFNDLALVRDKEKSINYYTLYSNLE